MIIATCRALGDDETAALKEGEKVVDGKTQSNSSGIVSPQKVYCKLLCKMCNFFLRYNYMQ